MNKYEVHVWWAFPNQIVDPWLIARHFSVLSETERQRYQRFAFAHLRHQYLVSHALVRDVLSRYAPVQPQGWRFEENSYGRPAIAEPAECCGLKFSLSHSTGRTVVAVASEIDLGVDVEGVLHLDDLNQIAEQHFSAIEIQQLREHPDWFYDFWTLKEAYIKARGMGLAIPLRTFSFRIANEERPTITFHQGCDDQAERWQFSLHRGEGFRMALAASFGQEYELSVTERCVVPLADAVHPRSSLPLKTFKKCHSDL